MVTAFFDAARSPGRVWIVPARRVVDLLQVTHAPEKVQQYREAMLAGDRFPPISVVRCGPWYVVADGHKRLAACRPGLEEALTVEVWRIGDLARDQWRQQRRFAGRLIRLLGSAESWRDPELAGFLRGVLRHWKRMSVSGARALSTGFKKISGPRAIASEK